MKDINITLEGENIRLVETDPGDVLLILSNTIKLMNLIKTNFNLDQALEVFGLSEGLFDHSFKG